MKTILTYVLIAKSLKISQKKLAHKKCAKMCKIKLGKNPKFEIAITQSKIVQMSSSFAYMVRISVLIT